MAFAGAGLDHDPAGTRLELAELLADDRPAVDVAETRSALDGLRRIGALRDADAAAHLLRRLARPAGRGGRTAGT